MRLTADDVRAVTFSRPRFGARGYREDEVDGFLDRVEATLRGTDRLTPAEVRDIAFRRPRFGQRGYDEQEVDAFLDLVEKTLTR
ncbi:DivIVA domain-containing protein [Nocardia cyriacigeorgica]|nr:DivIVA domain-containing protein [Nocardia cyriacigeorgica]MBF6435111.1 DivIVA domain-containing protein [Nocardia cyriacigeorgica]MBF6454830.1 DivIVA domain-containing protein [Nocardia cyriacigeorgica]MBF6479212.1 DivIVA domain-containing protein [Nocardia cyriacigeorgica]MBF6552725.1 DivIVA domain-containing protein [Nocardia cyriacigeorgica]NEW29258.1 DivIVA domain-containing protein [Nocardia cyriacigeorgica]